MPKRSATQGKPYCFVSYSTRESHVRLLIDCLRIVFTPHFEVRQTPSHLVSGASQLEEIIRLIKACSFGVVAIDGLRPNVVFEFGALHAHAKPVILLKEKDAQVDIASYYHDTPNLTVGAVKINLDTQLSDAKDLNYAIWNRFSAEETVKVVWDEYRKKRADIKPYIDVPEPKLW